MLAKSKMIGSFSYLNFLLKRNEFEEAIVCTNKGDAFVRDSNMFHAGRTNHTNFIRPMFAISIRKKNHTYGMIITKITM